LQITQSIELPGDCRANVIAIQILACGRCGFVAAATYEQLRPGSTAEPGVAHFGYRVDERGLNSLIDTINKCPHPAHAACPCPSHRALNWQDRDGCWQGLDLVVEDSFSLHASGS
jgi:hypothetical protein